MYITTKGLVLRSVNYKDSSKILTVLTETEGKLTVSARGALRKNSKMAAATQQLAFSEMTLHKSRDRWILTEALTIELFDGLSADIELLALGVYFAELLEALSDEDSPNPQILSLGLNALYLLSEGKRQPPLVKAAFELRMMCLSGFAPLIEYCQVCGEVPAEGARLDLSGGILICTKCGAQDGGETARLCAGSLSAMRHICSCGAGRVFAFTVSEQALDRLGIAAERYVTTQLDRRFGTLEYYKKIKL